MTTKTAIENYNEFVKVHGTDVLTMDAKTEKEYKVLVREVKKEHATKTKPENEDLKKYEEICATNELTPSTLFHSFVYSEKLAKKLEGEEKGKLVQVVVGLSYSKDGRKHQLTAYVKPSEIVEGSTVVQDIQLEKVKILALL